MSPLGQILTARLLATGPMTLAEYMAECLLHPQHGYYTTKPPFGREGDFTTAPEISQMFGELLGLALAQAWLDQGRPARFTLAELGPGRGTLMADVMRATRGVPGFHSAAQIHLVEASPRLRALQAQSLPGLTPVWLDHIGQLPDQPLYLLANEFFDALPIRQFQFDTAWRERVVTCVEGQLALALSAPLPAAEGPAFAAPVAGRVVETCPAAPAIIAGISQRLAEFGGAAFIVDYGDWRSAGDTFQALRDHAYCDPLAAPGTADLTAHVDFEALARAASKVTQSYTTQGAFLTALGIDTRSAQLAQGLSGTAQSNHLAAHRRLTHPQEMGSLFKVLGLSPLHQPPLPGFAS